MNYLTTFKLAVAVVLLACAVWMIERTLLAPVEVRQHPYRGIKMDDVDYVSCQRGDFSIEISRKGMEWFVDYPVRAAADDSVVIRLLSALENIEAFSAVTEDQRLARSLSLADYGLETPSYRIKTGGRYFLKELLVGNPAPVGDAVYVKFADENEVYAVPGTISNSIPDSIGAFRDPRILPGDISKTSRLEIHQPDGFVQIIRKNDEWWIQQPFSAPADGAAVESFLGTIFSMKAELYIWDPPVLRSDSDAIQGEALLDIYGFSEDVSPARITVWTNGDEIGREVIFGRAMQDKPGLIYARRKAFESIFAVRNDSAIPAAVRAVDLRDKLIFTVKPSEVREVVFQLGDSRIILHRYPDEGWMITEPVRWRADDDYVNHMVSFLTRLKVAGYRDDVSPDPAALRLDPPEFKAGIFSSRCRQNPGDSPVEEHLNLRECADSMVSFGQAHSNSTMNVILAGGQLAWIDSSALNGIDIKRLTDPLRYRERTVLSLASQDIRKIDLEVNSLKESICLGSNGVWISTSHTNHNVNMSVVSDILLVAANMRALEFEALNPKSLSGYGLEKPSISMTLGLCGDAGIQKTVMLGYKSGTDGIYGLIQGQDLLLILPRSIADIISRSLIIQPHADEPDQDQMGAGQGE